MIGTAQLRASRLKIVHPRASVPWWSASILRNRTGERSQQRPVHQTARGAGPTVAGSAAFAKEWLDTVPWKSRGVEVAAQQGTQILFARAAAEINAAHLMYGSSVNSSLEMIAATASRVGLGAARWRCLRSHPPSQMSVTKVDIDGRQLRRVASLLIFPRGRSGASILTSEGGRI